MAFAYSDIQQLISEWESPAVEFKSGVQKDAGDTISAFANTYGGVLVFGVDPKTKEPKGLQNPDQESIRLREILDNCKPSPHPEQEFVRHDGTTFIVLSLEAFPYSQNPCFYGDSCYIRQGTTNLKLKGEELIDFLKKRTLLNFEEIRAKAGLKDLDIERIGNLLSRRRIDSSRFTSEDYKRMLSALGVAGYNGDFFIKNVGLFFFAKEPIRFFSNFEVRIVKYSGTEPTLEALKFDKKVQGTLPELVDKTFDTVIDNIGKSYTISGTQRKEIPEYPLKSLRELITNAVGHRDYFDNNDLLVEIFDDRMQITNPGGLLAGQNIKNFDKKPEHRNPIAYRLLTYLGFGEGLGLGVRLIRREFRESKLPDPEFYEIGNAFRAIIYNRRSRKERHQADFENPRQKQALAYLQKNKKLKAGIYAKIVGVSIATAVHDLNELVKQGKIRRIGKYRGAYYETEDQIESN